jgi:hypothetical protein
MISYKFKLPQIKGVLQEGQGNGVVTEKVIGYFAVLSLGQGRQWPVTIPQVCSF